MSKSRTSTTIAELKAQAEGMVGRFTQVIEQNKHDNIRSAWTSLRRLYRIAENIRPPLSMRFSLEGEPETWPNALSV